MAGSMGTEDAKARRRRQHGHEVGDVFREHGDAYRRAHRNLSKDELVALRDLAVCSTLELGRSGELRCDNPSCGATRVRYKSCRHRLCPRCYKREHRRWVSKQMEMALPVRYWHLVLHLPSPLRPVALRNRKQIYEAFFKAARDTLVDLGRDDNYLGGEIGVLAVLETATEKLEYDPHLHVMVPGVALTPVGTLSTPHDDDEDLFPADVVHQRFVRKLIAKVRDACANDKLKFGGRVRDAAALHRLLDKLADGQLGAEVWDKEHDGSPENLIGYLAKAAKTPPVTNDRVSDVVRGEVGFWPAKGTRTPDNLIFVTPFEFISRFLKHVMPKGFNRVRPYGILSKRSHGKKLDKVRALLVEGQRTEHGYSPVPPPPMPAGPGQPGFPTESVAAPGGDAEQPVTHEMTARDLSAGALAAPGPGGALHQEPTIPIPTPVTPSMVVSECKPGTGGRGVGGPDAGTGGLGGVEQVVDQHRAQYGGHGCSCQVCHEGKLRYIKADAGATE